MKTLSSSSACQFANCTRLFEIFMPADRGRAGLLSIENCAMNDLSKDVGVWAHAALSNRAY
jgi:hypothetical protein